MSTFHRISLRPKARPSENLFSPHFLQTVIFSPHFFRKFDLPLVRAHNVFSKVSTVCRSNHTSSYAHARTRTRTHTHTHTRARAHTHTQTNTKRAASRPRREAIAPPPQLPLGLPALVPPHPPFSASSSSAAAVASSSSFSPASSIISSEISSEMSF